MKNYCKHCGEKLEPGLEHRCPSGDFLKKVKLWIMRVLKRIGVEVFFENNTDFYERGKNIAPDCVALDDGEISVKQYNLALLRSRSKFTEAEGRLQITNKRVLFRAA